LTPDRSTTTVLAVDIGGTKLAAGLVDAADGRILARATVATPRTDDPDVVFAALVGILRDLGRGRAGALACGIGSGGPMTAGGETISPVHIPAWRSFPLHRRMEEATGLPVFVDNDAKAVALGEGWVGAAAGVPAYIGMVVSTGIGGGIVLDGRLLEGRAGNAGHVGHVVVELDGQLCSCGGHGCVETVAAGPWLTRWALANGWAAPPGADARALAAAADAGDPVALRAFRRGASALAAMIASVAAVCDLDRVVLGGGVAKSGRTLFDPLHEALAGYAGLDFIRRLQVVPAALGDAGLIGAAALVAPAT
jgi:glucokinase